MNVDRRTLLQGLVGASAAAHPILTSAAVETASYRRPYGPDAPWNISVAGIKRHPQSNLYSERLYSDQPYRPGEWVLTFEGYTYPVYEATEATAEYTVRARHPDWGNLHGKKMLWSPAWRAPKGTDAQIIVLDPSSGREWNLWQVKVDHAARRIVCGSGSLVPGNYWTKTDGFAPPRGIGIQYLAMLVRPQEIEQGRIGHALSMPIHSPHSTIYVPPATKLEGHPMATSRGIPEGMRFALSVSDAEIEEWVAGLPSQLGRACKRSARIIARAMRDYGWFITDGGGAVHLQFEERLSVGAKWAELGLGEKTVNGRVYPRDLLQGLIRRERIYALVSSDQY